MVNNIDTMKLGQKKFVGISKILINIPKTTKGQVKKIAEVG